MLEQEPDRKVLIEAVNKSFPNDAEKILKEVRWSMLDGCWLFQYCGMTVGVEKDGYVHT